MKLNADNRLLWLGLGIIFTLVLVYIIYRIFVAIRRMIYRFKSRMHSFFNIVDEVKHAANNADKIESETPKSVSGMTSLLLPKISKDFPDFNWHEIRENFEAKIREKVTKEGGGSIFIHKSVISRYNKQSNNISVVCQTSLKYKNPKKQYPGEYKQSRFTTELVYMQKLDEIYEKDALGVYTCPNCGATVDNHNAGVCEYCGSKLRDLNTRIWNVADMQEDF